MIEPKYATFDEPEASPSLDLPTVKKFNWKSSEFRNYFQAAFDAIISSRSEWLIAQVAESDHPRQVATTTPDDWEYFVIEAGKRGLSFDRVDDETAIVAKSRKDIERWIKSDRRERAKLEGIPKCCTAEIGERGEPIYEAACASPSAKEVDGGDVEVVVPDAKSTLNVLWDYKGLSLIDYVPCSFECEASHEVAVQNGELLRKIGLDDEADLLWKWLNTSVTWDAYHGLVHLRNDYAIGERDVGDNWLMKVVRFGGNHRKLGVL